MSWPRGWGAGHLLAGWSCLLATHHLLLADDLQGFGWMATTPYLLGKRLSHFYINRWIF